MSGSDELAKFMAEFGAPLFADGDLSATAKAYDVLKNWADAFAKERTRESWEPLAASYVGRKPSGPDDMRTTLGLMATMLRNNMLPESGRHYISDLLQQIADGADPTSLLPSRHKKRQYSAIKIMVMVEKEKRKRGSKTADDSTLLRVATKTALSAKSVRTLASTGRRHIRQSFAQNIHANASGAEINRFVAVMSESIDLDPDAVSQILRIGPQLA